VQASFDLTILRGSELAISKNKVKTQFKPRNNLPHDCYENRSRLIRA
jgi:hypothetical protein